MLGLLGKKGREALQRGGGKGERKGRKGRRRGNEKTSGRREEDHVRVEGNPCHASRIQVTHLAHQELMIECAEVKFGLRKQDASK